MRGDIHKLIREIRRVIIFSAINLLSIKKGSVISKFRSIVNHLITLAKKGLIIAPLGETLPKKHHYNFTLKDAKFNKLAILKLKLEL